jgi:hypothetical protein
MNTLPQSDCQDTVNALQWASLNFSQNSRLLVHTAFYGWASLALTDNQIVPYGFSDPNIVMKELVKNGSSYQYYLIWWTNSSGWFGQPELSPDFRQVYQTGRIAIFSFHDSLTISSFSNESEEKLT